MNVVELLQHEDLDLPRSRSSGLEFHEFVIERCNAYLDLLKTVDSSDPLSEMVSDPANVAKAEKLAEKIYSSLLEYRMGFPARAYDSLKAAIVSLYLPALSRTHKIGEMVLYRARKLDSLVGATKASLFHVPFELREYSTTARYSIPGLPCLYFGTSTLLCWHELRLPAIDLMYFSRFQNTRACKVLDLTRNPSSIIDKARKLSKEKKDSHEFKYNSQDILDAIIVWPLLLACSIRVLNDGAPFKPEYIIPQILLQIVTDIRKGVHFVDGIAFSSTRCDAALFHPTIGTNYVFPSQNFARAGYCLVLKGSFSLTEPENWATFHASGFNKLHPNVYNRDVELRKGAPIDYSKTHFGKLESFLLYQKISQL